MGGRGGSLLLMIIRKPPCTPEARRLCVDGAESDEAAAAQAEFHFPVIPAELPRN